MLIRKFVLITLNLILSITYIGAQIGEGGTPPSFNYQSVLRSSVANCNVPVNLDVDNLLLEDEQNIRNGVPMRYAVVIPADINIDSTGVWTTLPDGNRIWRQTVIAEEATGIILSYKGFYIPKGGKLFIYNEDKSQILGSFTHNTNPGGGAFSTEIIYGDVLTLEYVESKISDEKPKIIIHEIGYAYRSLTFLPKVGRMNLNGSQSCIRNVNCEEGRNWQDQKRGVVGLLIRGTAKDWFYCSGSLVNNTANDGQPYILTASHCFKSFDYLNDIGFYFNYEFPTCTNETVAPASTRTLTGCELLVDLPLVGGSDGTLLKIKNVETIPLEWKPYYNGWDVSNTSSVSGAVIHHPNGDVKKINIYDSGMRTFTLKSEGSASNAHWEVSYNGVSVTEGGSSGSPLFNDKGLIIGTLTGGASECHPSKLKLPDYYGKIWYHWDRYANREGTPVQKMKTYLDPLNKNATSLKGYDPNGLYGIDDIERIVVREIVIFPNPSENELNINAASIIRKVNIFDMNGRKLFEKNKCDSSTLSVLINGWADGIYHIILQTDNGIFTEKFVKQ